jgi:hypothetical protein
MDEDLLLDEEPEGGGLIRLHRGIPGDHLASPDCWCRPAAFEWWDEEGQEKWVAENQDLVD